MKYLTLSVVVLTILFSEIHSYIVRDLEPAESELHTEFHQGGGKDYEEAQHSAEGEKGSKGYAGKHEVENGKKGFYDKEGHRKHYAEAGGNKKAHNHNDGYYADQHKSTKGQRGYHYADSGKYAKGHDTKGHHQIHKLNEYQKKTEFLDEKSDKAHKENHGAYEESKGVASGKSEKGGHHNAGFDAKKFANSGKFDKGHGYRDEAGYKNAEGKDQFHKNLEDFGSSSNADGYKEFESGYKRR